MITLIGYSRSYKDIDLDYDHTYNGPDPRNYFDRMEYDDYRDRWCDEVEDYDRERGNDYD